MLPIIMLIMDRASSGQVSRILFDVFYAPVFLQAAVTNEVVGRSFISSLLQGESNYYNSLRAPGGFREPWSSLVSSSYPLLARSVM